MGNKVKIGEILNESREFESHPDPERKIKVRLNCKGVQKRTGNDEKEGATKNYKRKAGQFIYGRQNFHKGAFGVIPKELDGFSSSADLPAFNVDNRCIPEWIYYWFKTGNRYKELSKLAKGIGSQRISTSDFFNLEIFLPSINEQEKIIHLISKLENIINSLSDESDNISTRLFQLRQSILQDAIEGKLTADWRKKNPIKKGDPETDAAALLEKIKKEKQKLITEGNLKKGKLKGSTKSYRSDLSIPVQWSWCKADDIFFVTKLAGFEYTKHISLMEEGDIPVIRAQNVRPLNIIKSNLLFIIYYFIVLSKFLSNLHINPNKKIRWHSYYTDDNF